MQVGRSAAVVLLLALGGCREEQSKQAEVFEPVSTAAEKGGPVPERVADSPEAPPSTKLPPQPPQGSAADITAGMSRDRLMEVLGDCAFRVAFIAGNSEGLQSFEVYQPKEGACAERFEERRMFVRGNTVESIQPGLDRAALQAATAPPGPVKEDIQVREN